MNGRAVPRASLAAAATVLVAAGAFFAWGRLIPPLAAFFGALDGLRPAWLDILLGADAEYFHPGRDLHFLLSFVPAAIAFAYLVAASAPRLATPARAVVRSRFLVPVVFIALPAASAFLWFDAYQQQPRNWDENTYLFQARIFAAGETTAELPACETHADQDVRGLISDNRNFFFAPLESTAAGRWFSQYPPLWPLVLALPVRWGISWLVNPILAAAAVAFLHALGRRFYGPGVAGGALLLAVFSPFVVFNAATHFSEPLFLVLSLAFVVTLFRKPELRAGDYVLAGALAGAATLTRELDAIILLTPFAVAHLTKTSRNRVGRNLAWLAAGAAPFAAAFLLYDYITTGYPLVTPRALNAVPTRYYVGFDAAHTPVDALKLNFRQLYDFAGVLLGWPLISALPACLLLVFKRRKNMFEITAFVCFAVHFIAYGSNRNTAQLLGPRYYFSLGVILILVTAGAFVHFRDWLREKKGWAAARADTFVAAHAAAGACYAALFYAPDLLRYVENPPSRAGKGWLSPDVRVAMEACPYTPAVIIIAPREACLPSMPNWPDFRDEVILARDQRDANIAVAATFAGRYIYLLDVGKPPRDRELILIYEPPEVPPADGGRAPARSGDFGRAGE